jgi:hypothetical protein
MRKTRIINTLVSLARNIATASIIIIINLTLIEPKAMQVSYLSLKAKENLTVYLCTKQDEKP